MATRFYLPSTGAAAVSPAFWSGWEKTDEADRLGMVDVKIGSAFATKACTENLPDPTDMLNRQYVSAPIGIHDFTGCTWKAYIRCLEDAAKADFILNIAVRVVSNDGNTIRFEISDAVGAEEFDDGELMNRTANDTSSANSSQSGDRIVVEIGIYAPNGKTTLYTGTMDFGDASGTDLPENETETAQYCPWIEFSHDIPILVTAWKSPGTCATADRSGGNNWASVDNAKTQSDTYAYSNIDATGNSDWLRCTNFGFTISDIPDNSTIDGIEVGMDKYGASGDDKIRDDALYLRKSSGQVGDDKATVDMWPNSDTDAYIAYGSSSDDWNSGLTDDDTRTNDFGIDLSAYNIHTSQRSARVDHIRIRVYYTEGEAPPAYIPKIIGPF